MHESKPILPSFGIVHVIYLILGMVHFGVVQTLEHFRAVDVNCLIRQKLPLGKATLAMRAVSGGTVASGLGGIDMDLLQPYLSS